MHRVIEISALLRISDALHDTSTLDDDLWGEAARVFDEPQRLELLLVAGFYHFVSYTVNASRVEREPWAARFPDSLVATIESK